MTNTANYTIKVSAEKSLFGKRTGNQRAILIADDAGVPVLDAVAKTATEAKQTLLNMAGTLADRMHARRYVFCTDGTVLVVYGLPLGSGYDIISVDRAHATGCTSSASFDATLAHAKAHAEQSYGGVIKTL